MTTTTTRRKSATKLQCKHFIAWLKEQGSDVMVGYIGDHITNPLEMWLSEVLDSRIVITSTDDWGFEYNGKKYHLSQSFVDFSICVLEGSLDQLPDCGWQEVTAGEMLDQVAQYLSADDFLCERSSVSAQQKDVTIVARYQFKADAKKVAYLVRSSDGATTYQTFLFDGRASSCTCPAKKPCYHMVQLQQREARRASEQELARINAEVLAQIEQEQAAPQKPLSEMARIANLEEIAPEKTATAQACKNTTVDTSNESHAVSRGSQVPNRSSVVNDESSTDEWDNLPEDVRYQRYRDFELGLMAAAL
jgi:hypothetical protein